MDKQANDERLQAVVDCTGTVQLVDLGCIDHRHATYTAEVPPQLVHVGLDRLPLGTMADAERRLAASDPTNGSCR